MRQLDRSGAPRNPQNVPLSFEQWRVMMAFAPLTVQCMPDRLRRVPISPLCIHLADAGGGTVNPGVKFLVSHAGAIAEDVQRALGGLGGSSGMRPESMDDGVQLAVIEFRAARRCPLLGFAGGTEDRLRGSVQSFFGMVPIEDLSSLWKQFRGGVPDPCRTVAQRYAACRAG